MEHHLGTRADVGIMKISWDEKGDIIVDTI